MHLPKAYDVDEEKHPGSSRDGADKIITKEASSPLSDGSETNSPHPDLPRSDSSAYISSASLGPEASSSLPPSQALDRCRSNDPPPDGGLVAWLQVLAALLVNTLTWGYASAFGVFQLHYVQALDLPASQVSWIGSIQVFLTFGSCVFSGRLADAGYCRSTLAVGTFLAVFGTFMTSLATTYWQILLAQGVCIGLGLGVAFMPAISVISSYFKKRRSFALSLSAVGTSLGSVSLPSVIQYLTPKIGFHWAVRCVGLIVLVFAVIANLLLKPRLAPRKTGPLIEWGAFRELPYLFFSVGSFFYYYALYFALFYINSYARNVIGFSTTDSVNLLIILSGMGIPARPIAGYISDRFAGPLNVFTFTTIALSVLLFGWSGVSTRGGMYAFSVVYGIIAGTNQGTFVAGLASMNKDPRKMGIRFGMIETLSSFATVAGAPTAGAIIDRSHGRYLYAQIWGGSVMAAAFTFFLACRMTITERRWMVKV
ncbi:Riboflavin transporter MCH5 [Escovopsis weberi]|uniref:Riboflavin transporter MCH5 n=1 Tax=Escovopsis weberi TaxID=150374 RepID=A0A0M8N482_ESCWE|nr:Riboflavin transporter MCH5 [Escovopsis weberi]